MKAVSLILLAAFLAGCGSGDRGTDRMVRTGQVETKTVAGRLTTTPPLLTLADVSELPKGSAEQAVMRLLFFAQWGSLPSVVDMYDDRVVTRLGVGP